MHGPHASVGRQRLPFESSFGLFESQQAIFHLRSNFQLRFII